MGGILTVSDRTDAGEKATMEGSGAGGKARMEGSSVGGKVRTEGSDLGRKKNITGLTDLMFSWSLEDIFNDNLYFNQVCLVCNCNSSFSFVLIYFTHADSISLF